MAAGNNKKKSKNKRQRTNDKYPKLTTLKGKERATEDFSYGYDDPASYDHDEEELEYDENGYVRKGYTISFSDEGFLPPTAGDSDEHAPRGGPGSQVLPVALGLPDDYDGDPNDGHEYLFLVRSIKCLTIVSYKS